MSKSKSKSKNSFLKRLKALFRNFFTTEAISSLFLLFCAGLAFYMANSSFYDLYEKIVNYPLSLNLGSYSIEASFHYIINEGLMALFFFLVGMEVKREFMEGELSSPKKALFPILAAVGGSLIPALIFFFFNQGLITEKGWGIPMATDIAFAIGVITLLSKKVPFALKIFLLSVAIIDDIIAVLIIALFYSQSISGPYLAGAMIVILSLLVYFKIHLDNKFLLVFLSLALWACFYNSGIHATLSGVILGCLIPSKSRFTEKQVLENVKRIFNKKEKTSFSELKDLKIAVTETKSVLQRLIHSWHPYVGYIIMPLFAFVNAGIPISGVDPIQWIQNPVSFGILMGLCVGKPIGIMFFSYGACLLKISQKPASVSWLQILAVGCLAGIGFTMSLFILNLAIEKHNEFYTFAKLSILVASLISALLGFILLSLGKNVPENLRKNPNL
ncbi:MAG: Na+/H+ antiporter NhaA [Bdellovibrionales bacterium]|nr:Na+/H+ antiporter NhaA [Bdellovibrionales bacterium]